MWRRLLDLGVRRECCLVIYICQEERAGQELLLCQRVVPVLGLDQQSLYPAHVGPVVEKSPDVVTQLVILPETLGQSIHPLLGASYGHEVVYLGLRTSLGQTSYKEAALGEAHCMVTI